MEDYEKELAELDRKREEILKKKEEGKASVTRKDLDDLRAELTKTIAKLSEPQSAQSGSLVLTDLSVHGPEPWKEGRVLGPETKPSRPEKVALRKWSEFPA